MNIVIFFVLILIFPSGIRGERTLILFSAGVVGTVSAGVTAVKVEIKID